MGAVAALQGDAADARPWSPHACNGGHAMLRPK